MSRELWSATARRVGEEREPPAELRGPGVALRPEREGQDADLLVLVEERNGHGAQAGRGAIPRRGRVEAGDLLLARRGRAPSPARRGRPGGRRSRSGRRAAPRRPVSPPQCARTRSDFVWASASQNCALVASEERHGLLAEGVLDARAVEGRREGAADLAQAVEEAVRLALAPEQPGRRHGEGDLDGERLERAEHRRPEGPGTAGAEADEDADDLAAGGERDGDEAERPREVLHRLGCRDEVEPLLARPPRRAGGRTSPRRRGARRGRAGPRRRPPAAPERPSSSRRTRRPGAGRAGGAGRRRGRGRSGTRSPGRSAPGSRRAPSGPPSAAWTRFTNATRSAVRRSASMRRAFSSAPAARRASSWTRRISCGVRTNAPRRDIVRKPKTVSPCSSGMARRRRRRGPLLSSASSSSSKAGPWAASARTRMLVVVDRPALARDEPAAGARETSPGRGCARPPSLRRGTGRPGPGRTRAGAGARPP